MAVELLEAMDESVVAKRAAELIKQSLSIVKSPIVPSNAAEAPTGFDQTPLDLFVPRNFERQPPDTSFVPGLGFHDFFLQDMAEVFGQSNHTT